MPTGTGAAAPTTEDGIPKWALPVGIGVAVLLLGGGIFFAARKKRK
jgi:LPXTG-motif cell wall-anchored protein